MLTTACTMTKCSVPAARSETYSSRPPGSRWSAARLGDVHANSVGMDAPVRRGLLRFSLHVYNNLDDVERVLGLTREFLARDRKR